MRAKSRNVLRKQGFKLDPLTPVSLRLPAELWQKCAWAAEAVGLHRTEFVRNTLTHATKDVRPPEEAKSRMILASADEWSAWHGLADRCGVSVNELVRRAVNRIVDNANEKKT